MNRSNQTDELKNLLMDAECKNCGKKITGTKLEYAINDAFSKSELCSTCFKEIWEKEKRATGRTSIISSIFLLIFGIAISFGVIYLVIMLCVYLFN